MQLKALKTEFVKFSDYANSENLKRSIEVGEETIDASKSLKYQDVSMVCDMLFQSQIKTTLKKMATSI